MSMKPAQRDGCWSRCPNEGVQYAGGGVLCMKAAPLLQFAELCASTNVMSREAAEGDCLARERSENVGEITVDWKVEAIVGDLASSVDLQRCMDSVGCQSKMMESNSLLSRDNPENGCVSNFEQDFPTSILNFVKPPTISVPGGAPSLCGVPMNVLGCDAAEGDCLEGDWSEKMGEIAGPVGEAMAPATVDDLTSPGNSQSGTESVGCQSKMMESNSSLSRDKPEIGCVSNFEQDFPTSILNFVKPPTISVPGGAPPMGYVLRADKDGAINKWDEGKTDGAKLETKIVCSPPSNSYPFARLLPGQCVEIVKYEENVITVQPVLSIPVLSSSPLGAKGDRCFCGRPHMGSLVRFSIMSGDALQLPLLGSPATRKLLKREHDRFCDYICLAKYLSGVFRARPFKGDRLLVTEEHIVYALEGFALDLIPTLKLNQPYVLSQTQSRLLSGFWPLCTEAARGIFKEAADQAEVFRLVELLKLEMNFRKHIIGRDSYADEASVSEDDISGVHDAFFMQHVQHEFGSRVREEALAFENEDWDCEGGFNAYDASW